MGNKITQEVLTPSLVIPIRIKGEHFKHLKHLLLPITDIRVFLTPDLLARVFKSIEIINSYDMDFIGGKCRGLIEPLIKKDGNIIAPPNDSYGTHSNLIVEQSSIYFTGKIYEMNMRYQPPSHIPSFKSMQVPIALLNEMYKLVQTPLKDLPLLINKYEDNRHPAKEYIKERLRKGL